MKVVKPVSFDPAVHLISSNATEPNPAWSSATNYALDAVVSYNYRLYRSLVANNLNKVPSTSIIEWVDIGPTNIYAMFDSEINTATTKTSPLTVTIAPGIVNSLGLFGLIGESVTITMTNGAGGATVYNKTISLNGTVIADWYQYFYEPTLQLSELVVTDIPPYANGRITISITSATSSVAVGILSVGTVYDLGATQFNPEVGIIDYSKKETDANGKTSFVKKAFSKRMQATMMLDNGQLNKVSAILNDLRATPCIWIGSDDPTYNVLLIYGFYRDFSITIPYAAKSLCSLEVEGLT